MTAPDMETIDRVDGQRLAGVSGYISEAHQGLIASGSEPNLVGSAKPTLLDLFCGAGGAGEGYSRAGFAVTGVDIKKQPNYPFAFFQGDALEYLTLHGREFDVIHASPPCQGYIQRNKNLVTKWPKLIESVREAMKETGKPYVLENVEGAPLRDPILLCGTMFGLQVRRHRLFECSTIFVMPPTCNHWGTVSNGDFAAVYGRGGKGPRRGHGKRDPKPERSGPEWSTAMGIHWMTANELREAIPPAYTEYLGKALYSQWSGSSAPLRYNGGSELPLAARKGKQTCN